MELRVELLKFEVGQQKHAPTEERLAILAVHDGRRHVAMLIVVMEHGKCLYRQRSVDAIVSIASLFDDAEYKYAGDEHR
jgi:hypothetical protein